MYFVTFSVIGIDLVEDPVLVISVNQTLLCWIERDAVGGRHFLDVGERSRSSDRRRVRPPVDQIEPSGVHADGVLAPVILVFGDLLGRRGPNARASWRRPRSSRPSRPAPAPPSGSAPGPILGTGNSLISPVAELSRVTLLACAVFRGPEEAVLVGIGGPREPVGSRHLVVHVDDLERLVGSGSACPCRRAGRPATSAAPNSRRTSW